MTNAAPQSASATDTRHGPNSDDLNTAAPFPFLVLNFLASYYKIGQQDGRMLMHRARAYDLKDSEALRWAKIVQQAENFCHNRNGEHKWHWAKDKADNYLIRVYEQWPDLNMHERLCRGKMALGGVATFFQYAGNQTDAEVALDDFIRTGLIPQPKPISEATREAVKLEDIAKRSAELETGVPELDKWFGPKKESKAVTDSSNGKILGDYLKTQQSWGVWWTSAKNLCKANGIEDDKAQEAHIHEILLGPDYGTRSAKTYPGAPGDALGAIKDSFSKPKTKASETSAKQPPSAPVASTPVTEPAKVNEPVAPKIAPVTNGKPDADGVIEGELVPEPPKALATVPAGEIILFDPNRALATIKAKMALLNAVHQQILVKDVDYGKVPGTDKDTLLKPGAEKLLTAFDFYPLFKPTAQAINDWKNGLFVYEYECVIYNRATGRIEGSGIGNCSSMESKYRYRKAERKCPNCGKANIRKSKDKPQFYCWTKTDGCGATFPDNDPAILSQPEGRIENPDIFDQVNTLSKMAQKRALVAATLNATGASAVFTQDMEDFVDYGVFTEKAS